MTFWDMVAVMAGAFVILCLAVHLAAYAWHRLQWTAANSCPRCGEQGMMTGCSMHPWKVLSLECPDCHHAWDVRTDMEVES